MNVLKWASYDSDFKPNTLDMRFRLYGLRKGSLLTVPSQIKDNY